MFRKILQKGVTICDCISHSQRHAVITGATSGLGLATAHELARRQWSLTLACRDLDRGEVVKQILFSNYGNDKISVRRLDLDDLQSIKSFAGSFKSSDALDVFICNAGTWVTNKTLSNSIPNIDLNMMTNFLGSFFLLKLLLPRFENKPNLSSGEKRRIIFVSSSLAAKGDLSLTRPDILAQRIKWDSRQSYANSKQALNLCVREIFRLYGTGNDRLFDVYCLITGGMIATNLNRHFLARYPTPIAWFLQTLCRLLLKSPQEGCQNIIHCAISDNVVGAHSKTSPPPNKRDTTHNGGGLLYRDCRPIKWPASSELGDISIAVYSEANRLFQNSFS